MGPIAAITAILGVYTSMLWLTGRRLKEATEAFLRREQEIDKREAEMLKKVQETQRPMEF
jgi:hypothetical protein